ncbi:MAG: DUF86 domain-containing protein [Ignavibacteriales bacterium]|nr:DUF86 domain-containing protein [Ignavibacteriales bacterium]
MKKEERSYIVFLDDIALSIQRIREYVAGHSLDSFAADYKTVDAVIRNFEIIGEAAKRIPDKIKERYPNIPWEEMYRLRNRVSHDYFGIDYEIILDIAVMHLPINQMEVEEIIRLENSAKTK